MNKAVLAAGVAGAGLILALAAGLTYLEDPAVAQTTPQQPSGHGEKMISVTGIATASADPDLLVVTIGVETEEKTARDALATNSQSMKSVVDAMSGTGIPEDDMSTSQLTIRPIYESYRDEDDRYVQELVGYRVTNMLTVRTTYLDSAANIVDGAVRAGANMIHDIYFTLSPDTALQIKDGLIEQAVLNAKAKAENALAPLDHRIVGVKKVSLSEFGIPPPMPVYADRVMAEAMADASHLGPTPIFSSGQDVQVTANVVFLISDNG